MTLKQALPILTAIDAGEPWQYEILTNWHDGTANDDPISCIIRMCEIRLKPQAHKPEKWAAERKAYAEGKRIQYRVRPDGRWKGFALLYPDFDNDGLEWRIAPEPTYIPLGPGDVPPGTVLRGSGELDSLGWCLITSCSETGIRLWRHCDPDYQQEITWEMLHRGGSQILIPGETEWKLCRKESK